MLTKTEQKNKELQRYEGDLLKCLEERGALEAAAEETDNSTLTRPQLVNAAVVWIIVSRTVNLVTSQLLISLLSSYCRWWT